MSNPTGDALKPSAETLQMAIELLRANGYRVFPAERVKLVQKFGVAQLIGPDDISPERYLQFHHDRLKKEVGMDAAWTGALVEELAPEDAHARFSVSMMIVLPKPPEN